MFKNKYLERLLWLVLLAALIYTAHNTLKTFVLMTFNVLMQKFKVRCGALNMSKL